MQQAESGLTDVAIQPFQNSVLSTADQLRVNAYSLLANLLHRSADVALLAMLSDLDIPDGPVDDMAMSWQLLKLAAQQNSSSRVDDEFHDLFIGLGHGEVIPYGSWYQTGYLMDKPLAKLRRDLMALGIQRGNDIKEPEDHIAALCESMALLIMMKTPLARQKAFFNEHISGWALRLFADLERAPSACFYQAVAHFGKHFVKLETQYL
ncbi:MAG: molecular chaperone TorD family protein [Gammaproteobacteria bacterium]